MLQILYRRLVNLFTGKDEKGYDALQMERALSLTNSRMNMREIQRLQIREKEFRKDATSKLKQCRAIMREHNLGHLYPGANVESEKYKPNIPIQTADRLAVKADVEGVDDVVMQNRMAVLSDIGGRE